MMSKLPRYLSFSHLGKNHTPNVRVNAYFALPSVDQNEAEEKRDQKRVIANN